MTVSGQIRHKEQRLAVVLSVLFVVALLELTPERIRLFKPWVPYVVAVGALLPLVAVMLVPGKMVLLKIERVVTLIFCVCGASLGVVNLAKIVNEMLAVSDNVNGMRLLLSGISVWANNVISFSILFWIIDRGGPICRASNKDTNRTPDWLFPQETAPSEDLPRDWKPAYIDYLFLAFCTGTAFSPTDILPLTHRAKLLVMIESLISLATVIVVLSRAVNILR